MYKKTDRPLLRGIKKNLYGTLPYYFTRLYRPGSEKLPYYKFVKDNGYTRYPYPFAEKYLSQAVDIKEDTDKRLKYIIHRNKKLYFPFELSDPAIEKLYKSLLMEQDACSAHCYVDSTDEFRDKIILDIGAAEGIISLEAVEVAKYIYLFECQDKWIRALTATFAPWKEKVRIIDRFVGDKDDGLHTTLDRFFEDKVKENLFIKMDVEGSERHVLAGAKTLFSTAKNLHFAVCTYHKRTDKKVIASILDEYGCTYTARKGFFYTKHSFRTALFRGYK